jgi:hypothetical protein
MVNVGADGVRMTVPDTQNLTRQTHAALCPSYGGLPSAVKAVKAVLTEMCCRRVAKLRQQWGTGTCYDGPVSTRTLTRLARPLSSTAVIV